MARKKPSEGSQRRKRSRSTHEGIPDPRMTEDVLRHLVADLGGGAEENTPLAKAQAVLQRAYQTDNEKERVKLAQKALDLCPDFADAYVLLAEHATSRKEGLELYEKGVQAGERAIGPETVIVYALHKRV